MLEFVLQAAGVDVTWEMIVQLRLDLWADAEYKRTGSAAPQFVRATLLKYLESGLPGESVEGFARIAGDAVARRGLGAILESAGVEVTPAMRETFERDRADSAKWSEGRPRPEYLRAVLTRSLR